MTPASGTGLAGTAPAVARPGGAAGARPVKVAIRDLTVRFAAGGSGPVRVLENLDLEVYTGELVCILGPSGCGKSTLLNVVGGFVRPTGGTVSIDGEPVTGPDPRRIFVFQERGVFPWLTVEGNIGFGLHRLPAAERAERIRHYVELV
ncbi:MAG TPA: ATP-binding cassette domain-containing protein, partial [Thermoanaerobaculia bacterium]|nr:ATP-binding cassette domain-containing protein [Thermoanaerobaculia bacterium]